MEDYRHKTRILGVSFFVCGIRCHDEPSVFKIGDVIKNKNSGVAVPIGASLIESNNKE